MVQSPQRLIARIPGEGAQVVPVVGDGINPAASLPVPAGLQAVTSYAFRAASNLSRAQMIAQITADPSELVDESPRLESYLRAAIAMGWPIALSGTIYVNTPIDIAVDGKAVHLQCIGDAWIIGGPNLDAPLIKIANSSTVGGTPSRSVPISARGFQFDVSKAPYGVLNSVNCFNFSGFRSTTVEGNYFYHGSDYREGNTGGDSALFTTSNYVVFKNNMVRGAADLAVYASGSSTGTVDNISLYSSGNVFIRCANGIAVKRNYRYLKSVGDHFEQCFNGISALPAGGTGYAQLCGSRVSVAVPTFHNMLSKCIDPRSSSNWNVSGAVASGGFGYDLDGVVIADAAVISISGSSNCSIDMVIEIEGSTDPSHSAVRVTQHTNTQNGVLSQSSMNRVRISAKGIYNGLIENTGSTNNSFELNLSGVTVPFTMPSNNGSFVRLNVDGVRSEYTGNIDTTPKRRPFGGDIKTANFTVSLNSIGRTLQIQPAASAIKAILPSGAVNGDIIHFYRHPSSGTGLVQVRNPGDTGNILILTEPGQYGTAAFDGTNWVPIERYTSDQYMTFRQLGAASVPTPPANCRTLFLDTDNVFKAKDSTGTVTAI